MAFPQSSFDLSPNERWQISCLTKGTANGWWEHTLYVAPHGSDRAVELFVTGRWCEVLWREKEDVIAVTDWAGSNVSSVFLVDVRQPADKRDILSVVPQLTTFLSADERQGHLYWEALEWKGSDTLLVRAFGHTDEAHGHAFCLDFSVDLAAKSCAVVDKDITDAAEEHAWESKSRRDLIGKDDPGAANRNRMSLHDSSLAAKAEAAIRRKLETDGGDEDIATRRYFTGDLDGDGQDDLLVVTCFTNGVGNYWSHDFVLIRSSKPDTPVIRNFGAKGVRSYRDVFVSRRGIAVDFLYYSETDSLCCPSVQKKGYFALFGDSLWEVDEPQALKSDRAYVAEDGKYIIRAGDTGASIAQHFGMTIAELAAANPGVKWDRLRVGDALRITATR